jgi:hypothetical protein
MGKHSVYGKEKSSYGMVNGEQNYDPKHKPRHEAQQTTPSDLPHRDGRDDKKGK